MGLPKGDVYSTHLPILEAIKEWHGEFKNVLEFGMGMYSTPYLVNNCKILKSIETDSKEWFKRIKDLIKADNWEPLVKIGPRSEMDFYQSIKEIYWDLILVDGAAECRSSSAQISQDISSVVVCHDSDEPSDRYQDVLLKDGWIWLDIKDYVKWTGVITGNIELINVLKNKFKKTELYVGSQLKNKKFI